MGRFQKVSLCAKLNRFPPRLCRLVAAPATTRQIAMRSGIPRSTVHQISMRSDWNGVTLENAEKFSRACGVDLLITKRHKQNLRNKLHSMGKLAKRVKPTQRKMLDRLLRGASK